MLSFDGVPRTERRRCPDCGEEHDSVVGDALRDETAYAVYWADWYPHGEEAGVDVALGSWQAPDHPDNVTFSCRIGQVDNQTRPACSLVAGAQIRSDERIFDHKLDREEALEHPWLGSFCKRMDWLILHDATLNRHILDPPPS